VQQSLAMVAAPSPSKLPWAMVVQPGGTVPNDVLHRLPLKQMVKLLHPSCGSWVESKALQEKASQRHVEIAARAERRVVAGVVDANKAIEADAAEALITVGSASESGDRPRRNGSGAIAPQHRSASEANAGRPAAAAAETEAGVVSRTKQQQEAVAPLLPPIGARAKMSRY